MANLSVIQKSSREQNLERISDAVKGPSKEAAKSAMEAYLKKQLEDAGGGSSSKMKRKRKELAEEFANVFSEVFADKGSGPIADALSAIIEDSEVSVSAGDLGL